MKSLLILLLAASPNVSAENVYVNSSNSQVTPELTKYCKNAGGEAKVFPDSCTNTCTSLRQAKTEKSQGRAVRCLPKLTADCDCGQNRCLENNNCIPMAIDEKAPIDKFRACKQSNECIIVDGSHCGCAVDHAQNQMAVNAKYKAQIEKQFVAERQKKANIGCLMGSSDMMTKKCAALQAVCFIGQCEVR